MEATQEKPASNGFVRTMRKVYNPLGFKKGYNAILWFIFDGAMLGFVLARFQFLNIFGVYCPEPLGPGGKSAAPGECYWYRTFPRNRIGIILHLGCILPAAFLVVFQFIPIIRFKAILYHRIAGYVIFLLVLISDAGALMVANHSFNGDLPTQAFIGTLVIITTISLVVAYINVKRLQIDQHRAWMLRAWFYFASIISLRIIQIIAAMIISLPSNPPEYAVQDCANIVYQFINTGQTTAAAYQAYPGCDPSSAQYSAIGKVIVAATFNAKDSMQPGSALDLTFGMAGWLALTLHAAGIEIYLHLTPKEGDRLRQLSYEKQLEAGYKNPGYAGLVVEKLGDANPWLPRPTIPRKESGNESSGSDLP